MNSARDDGWVLREWRAALGHDRSVMPATVPIGVTVTVGRFTFITSQEKLPPKLVQSVLGTKRMNRKRTERKPAMLVTLTGPRASCHDPSVGQREAYRRAMETGRWAA